MMSITWLTGPTGCFVCHTLIPRDEAIADWETHRNILCTDCRNKIHLSEDIFQPTRSPRETFDKLCEATSNTVNFEEDR